MIILTGDVHHYIASSDQLHTDISEVCIAKEYIKIAHEEGIKSTLFLTGKIFEKNKSIIKSLFKFGNLEVGGHTYKALRPTRLHRAFEILSGSYYGPSFYQEKDIRKTLYSANSELGIKLLSWRTHAYASDRKTYDLLYKNGFKVISDKVKKDVFLPVNHPSGLISLPINCMPDHTHIFHGSRTPELVNSLKWSDDFTSESYTIEKWFRIIKSQVEKTTKIGIATLQVHPICMYVTDRFETFSELCRFLSQFRTLFVKEVTTLFENKGKLV